MMFAGLSLTQPRLLSSLLEDAGSISATKSQQLMLLIVAAILTSCAQAASVYSEGKAAAKLRYTLQKDVVESPLLGYNSSEGELLQICTTNVDTVVKYHLGLISKICPGLIMLTVALYSLFRIDVILTVTALLLCAILLVASLTIFRKIGKTEAAVLNQRNVVSDTLLRHLHALKTANFNGRDNYLKKKTKHELKKLKKSQIDAAYWRASAAPVNNSLLPIIAIIILGVASVRIKQGALTSSDLVSYLMYLFILVGPLLQAVSLAGKRGEAIAAWKQYMHFIEGKPSDPDASIPTEVLERVNYVLKSKLPRYGIVAVTGRSGVGKTTLLNKMAKRFGPDLVAYVEQVPPMWTPTGESALLLYSDKKSWKKFRLLCIKFGLNREIIRRSMDKLSGGEKQRIAVSAALAAEKRIILLDEPTSALSGEDQIHIAEEINATSKENKLVIIVSHDSRFIDHLDKPLMIRID